jgi:stearoyl-CoA desaturase (delta-9 desaturase)
MSGEAWHHNHHAFARSAFHGLRRWEAVLDPSGWIIRVLRRPALAWNVVEITPDRQTAREGPPSGLGPGSDEPWQAGVSVTA